MTRLLLIADDAFSDERTLPACVAEIGHADAVHVVAPRMASRLDTVMEDQDAYDEADDRADEIVAQLRAQGIEATGERSAEDPFDSAVAALAAQDYDGVVIATTGDGHWSEDGAVRRLRDATDLDVTHVVIED